MAKQTLNNNVLYGEQRTKINANFTELYDDIASLDKTDVGLDQVDNTSDLDKPISTATADALEEQSRPYWIDYTAPATNLYDGTVNSGTVKSLTDTRASWTVNEWINKIVKIYKAGGTDFTFAVVESNTSNTLTFDDKLIIIPCDTCSYSIINTIDLENQDLPVVIALNIEDNQAGVLLPKSDSDNERRYIHPYIERASNGTYIAPVICRGTDRLLGAKYATLEHFGEGIRLLPHTYLIDHFDALFVTNVERLATGYMANDEAVTTTTFAPVGNEANLIYDNKKRFVEVIRSGKKWLRYTSLIPRTFLISFTAAIIKGSEGEGELDISLRLRLDTGVEEDLTTRISMSSFGAEQGVETIIVEVPVALQRDYEVIPISRRNKKTFSIGAGSTIKVIEF